MIRDLWVLLGAEARMQLRQPLVLALLVLFPALTGPGMVAFGRWYQDTVDLVTPEAAGERHELPVAVPDEVAAWIEPDDALRVVPPADAVAELTIEDGEATVRHDASARSVEARSRLKGVVLRHEREATRAALEAAGIEGEPLVVVRRDVAGEGVGTLAVVLPAGLLLVVLLAAAYVAIDLFTGERERGTLETLLASRADRRAVVVAKLGVVVVEGACAGFAWLAWMAAGHLSGLVPLGALPPTTWVVLALAVVGVAFEGAAVAVVVATVSPTYRAASFVIGPVMTGVVTLGVVGALPVELGPLALLLPVGNLGIAIRDGLAGALGPARLLAVAVGTAAHVVVATGVAGWLVGREGALFAAEDTRALRQAGYHGRDAAALFGGVLLALWFFGQAAQEADLVAGMVFTQVALFALPAVAVVLWAGARPVSTLSLGWPGWRNLALAVVAGALAPGVGTTAVLLVQPWLPLPSSLVEALSGLTLPDGPWWAPLVVFALLPGLCEELLFRGALLGLTRRSLGPVPRVLLNASLFAALHLSVHRLAPTGALGVLLAVITLRTGSLWPAVIVHALNNGIALTVASESPLVGWSGLAWAAPAAIGAALAVAAMRPTSR